ncbi:hypothetical protein F5Y16DRAFT_403568 [Xylariaceae sp. FL0255]|nr:hypothetical protein F5Y16DRAFT_403568 [Xylariaceae sp. FL0255]
MAALQHAHDFVARNAFIVPAVDMAVVMAPRAQITSPPQLPRGLAGVEVRDDTAQVPLFLDAADDYKFAGSIVSACSDATVYALQCTEGPDDVGSATCGSNAEVLTVTANDSLLKFSTAVSSNVDGTAIKGTEAWSCAVTTSASTAVCSVSLSASADGQSTKTASVLTITGSEYATNVVDITAGATKTASPSGKCNSAGALNARVWTAVGVAAAAAAAVMAVAL